ncbi:unnamed protein product [Diamesa serratosioi]
MFILFGGIHSSHGDELTILNGSNVFNVDCQFSNIDDDYACETIDLEVNQKDAKLNEILGTHLSPYENANVMELNIANSSMLFLSNDLFIKFPSLASISIYKAKLGQLYQGDFSSAAKLKTIMMYGNEITSLGSSIFEGAEELTNINLGSNGIETISNETFKGLINLKYISLKDNLITELELGTFDELINLRTLILNANFLKFLDGKLLQFNSKLISLSAEKNQIRIIGVDILNYSTKLRSVDFTDNMCIDENSADTSIEDVIVAIKTYCHVSDV